MSASILICSILVWFGLGAFLSWKAKRKNALSMAEYFLGNRGIGGFLSSMTYSATTYSAFMMVGLVGITYKTGITSLGFELSYLIGTVFLLMLFAPRYWSAGKAFNVVTPSEMLSVRYEKPKVGVAAAILCLVMLIPYASVQLMGAGYLLETLSEGAISFTTATVIIALMSFVFSWWAGIRSVALTDALQASIMLIASIMLAFFIAFTLLPEAGESITTINPNNMKVSWPFHMFLGLTLPWLFFAVTNPQVVQRLYIPKNVTSIRNMILGFSFFGFVYTLLCVFFGISASKLLPGIPAADKAMPRLLSMVPHPLALIVTLSIIAAAVSTMNSIILTLSSMFGRDILKALNPHLSEQKELILSKTLIPVITGICLVFAQYKFSMIAILSSMASGGLLMQLPSIWGTFFWKKATAEGAFWSIVIGGISVGAMYITGAKPLGIWPPVWGIAVSFLVFVALSLFTTPPPSTDIFMDRLKKELKNF